MARPVFVIVLGSVFAAAVAAFFLVSYFRPAPPAPAHFADAPLPPAFAGKGSPARAFVPGPRRIDARGHVVGGSDVPMRGPREAHAIPAETGPTKYLNDDDAAQHMSARMLATDIRHLICLRCTPCCRSFDPERYRDIHLIDPYNTGTLSTEEVQTFTNRLPASHASPTSVEDANLRHWLFTANALNLRGKLTSTCAHLRERAWTVGGMDLPSFVPRPFLSRLLHSLTPAMATDPAVARMLEMYVVLLTHRTLPARATAAVVDDALRTPGAAALPAPLRSMIGEYTKTVQETGSTDAAWAVAMHPCETEFLFHASGMWDFVQFRAALSGWATDRTDVAKNTNASCVPLSASIAAPLRARVHEILADMTGLVLPPLKEVDGDDGGGGWAGLLESIRVALAGPLSGSDPIQADPIAKAALLSYIIHIHLPAILDETLTLGAWACHVTQAFFVPVDKALAVGTWPRGRMFEEAAGLAWLFAMATEKTDAGLIPGDTLRALWKASPLTRGGLQWIVQNAA